MMNNRPDIPKLGNNLNYPQNVFLKKNQNITSPISSDLPSKFGIDSLNSNTDPRVNIMSETSPYDYNPRQNNFYSSTSSEDPNSNKTKYFTKTSNRKYTNQFSDTSSEMPNRNSLYSQTSPMNTSDNGMMYSQTSPMPHISNKYQYSDTSSDYNMPNKNISQTSDAPINMPNNYFNNNLNDNNYNNFDWKNMTLYFSQIDMDISWMDKKNESNSLLFGDLAEFFGFGSPKKPLPVVCDINKAVDVAQKICKYALYINDPIKKNSLIKEYKSEKNKNIEGIESSTEKDKFSYPIFGSVIFALKFTEKPSIINIGNINKDNYNMVTNKSNYDVVLYNASWDQNDSNTCRAVIFNMNKIEVTDIYLKQSDCAIGGAKGLALLKILKDTDSRFNSKYIKLLEYLYNNGQVNLKFYDSLKNQIK